MQLLKFFATWCNPCKTLTKTLEDVQFPYKVTPVDIDQSLDLAIQYSIKSVPTMILVDDDGKTITKLSNSKATKEEIVSQFITEQGF
jgi:thioredoxin-like negative regulator of GroEL